jgi:hypothetical protein
MQILLWNADSEAIGWLVDALSTKLHDSPGAQLLLDDGDDDNDEEESSIVLVDISEKVFSPPRAQPRSRSSISSVTSTRQRFQQPFEAAFIIPDEPPGALAPLVQYTVAAATDEAMSLNESSGAGLAGMAWSMGGPRLHLLCVDVRPHRRVDDRAVEAWTEFILGSFPNDHVQVCGHRAAGEPGGHRLWGCAEMEGRATRRRLGEGEGAGRPGKGARCRRCC